VQHIVNTNLIMLHAVATICEKRLVSYSHYWNGTLWPHQYGNIGTL